MIDLGINWDHVDYNKQKGHFFLESSKDVSCVQESRSFVLTTFVRAPWFLVEFRASSPNMDKFSGSHSLHIERGGMCTTFERTKAAGSAGGCTHVSKKIQILQSLSSQQKDKSSCTHSIPRVDID
jgi:hypothetical protein